MEFLIALAALVAALRRPPLGGVLRRHARHVRDTAGDGTRWHRGATA